MGARWNRGLLGSANDLSRRTERKAGSGQAGEAGQEFGFETKAGFENSVYGVTSFMTGPSLVHYILMIAALICFFLAFVRYREPGPVSVGWLGFCFWVLDLLLFTAGGR